MPPQDHPRLRAVSITEDPPPLSDEWLGVVLETPEKLAGRLGWEAERVFDDLDYFSFVGFEADGHRMGLKRYRGDKAERSVIHLGNGSSLSFETAKHLICLVFRIEPSSIKSKDEVLTA